MPGAYAQIAHELDVIERAGLPGVLPHRPRPGRLLPPQRASSARAAAPPPTPRSATPSGSPRSTRCGTACCSSASSPPSGTGRRTSTSTSSPVAARRSSSTSTPSTAAPTPRRSPTSSPTGPESAVRDAARALGYDVGQQDAWSKSIEQWGSLRDASPVPALPEDYGAGPARHRARCTGRSRPSRWPRSPSTCSTSPTGCSGCPRHLGIHSGGMVMCDRPVIEVCPVEWATHAGTHGAAVGQGRLRGRRAGEVRPAGAGHAHARCGTRSTLVREHEGRHGSTCTSCRRRTRTSTTCCARRTPSACSRSSPARRWATLPRLRPRRFYDIVVEVALIRPGPDPGRLGAPVHRPLRRAGRRSPTCTRCWRSR